MRKFTKFLIVGLAVLLCQIALQAQTTGSIVGTVTDPNGSVVPGATIKVKGEAGQGFSAVTNENGVFRVPAVASGVYAVTISAQGFKTSSFANVKVDIGTPATVEAKLEVGNVGEVVEITSGGEVLQTATATVGTTITGRQIKETPISSRDALDLILRLPGVAGVGAPRQSSINGLPKGAIQMSLDGVDNQDNVLRSSDGFFTFVRPRVDAIEEVTVSTANPGAESTGDGAVQVRFVTKRGTNDYRGTAYWQARNTVFNSAYWYNNRDLAPLPGSDKAPRDVIILTQPGIAVGGPIPFPRFGEGGKWFDSGKDKAFFFTNYEQYRLPQSILRTRTVINPEIQTGLFKYNTGAGTQSVNLFNIAAANGQVSTIDPTVNTVLNEIRAATGTTGTFGPIANNVNAQAYNFQNPANGYREFLAIRIDANVTKNHSAEFVMNRQNFHPSIDTINGADQPFPNGHSYGQGGIRNSWAYAVRSTLSENIVNEVRYAVGGGGTAFNDGSGPADFASQNGFSLGAFLPGMTALRAGASNNFSFRTTPTYDLTDNLTWVRGNHALAIGGQWKRILTRNTNVARWVPSVGFGIDQSETVAFNMFNATTMPGASAAQITDARNFYAGLTGRVITYTNASVLTDQGVYQAAGTQITSVKQTIYGLYGQDTWRMRPNLTVTYGLRWQPDFGVENRSKNQSRLQSYDQIWGPSGVDGLFKPGTVVPVVPKTQLLEIGEAITPKDLNNFAPSVGVVWSPNFGDKSFLTRIFGTAGKTVLRGGYSMSFVREGLNVGSQVVAGPGGTINNSRSAAIAGSLTVGTLFRQGGANPNLTPFNFSATPNFPITLGGTDQAFAVDPSLNTGVVHSYSFGIQREIDKNTVLEVRYVGNREVNGWRLYGINERNSIENGIANEFLLAQQNLYANIAANRCQAGVTAANCQYNFAYFGPGTGTSPLPIALAYFNGANGGGPVSFTPGSLGNSGSVTSAASLVLANYGNALFRNMTTFANLNRVAASPVGYAGALDVNAAARANAAAAGLPINFQLANGTLPSGAFILGNSQNSTYDSMVLEVRRRLSDGLRVQASYVWSKAMSDFFAVSAIVNASPSLRPDGLKLAKTVQPFDIRHVFKLDATYDLPVGRGRWLAGNASGLRQALLGGFSIFPVVTWQSGAPIQLGNAQLIGMTVKDLQDAVEVRFPASGRVMWLPDDIIQNSQKAFDTSIIPPTGQAANGYGATFGAGGPTGRFIAPFGYGNCQQKSAGTCGFNNLVIYGPMFFKVDVGLSKKFAIGEKRSIELKANVLNLTNRPNFKVGGFAANISNTGCCGAAFGELVTGSAYRDTNTTNDPGGRVIDWLLRFNF